ncbi:MAG TPA: inositol monophosphatase [Draconibacterium sp.]|nr:inositol monophosphatase [Draconibacterium sp.]HRX13231.1 inositol monophosphatase [Draconibacterium sp.]
MERTVRKALHGAGIILMHNFGKITDYEEKESQSSIVTKADIESEKKIIEIISEKFPDHNTLGEETGFQNRNSEFTWVIDPLDGTSNFAAGLPWFGVIICVLKNSIPFLAGCFLPVQNELYFAEKGRGATCNGKKITVSDETKLKNILAAYSLDFSDEPGKTEHETKVIGTLVKNIRNLRGTNCLIDFCYTADGKLGACINQTTKIWDIAAPGLIIEEAGGIVTDILGNQFDFSLNETNYNRNFNIVCSNKMLHAELIKLMNHGF